MKKLISIVLMLLLCVMSSGSAQPYVVKTQALNIPLKKSFENFNVIEQNQIETLSSISISNPSSKANYINQIDDDDLFEYCLKETLDSYYKDPEIYSSQISIFKDNISPAADNIIKNYELAAEERKAAFKNGYSPTEVLVSLDPGTSKESIDLIGKNIGKGYEVIFDGYINPVDDVPEYRKKALQKVYNKNFGTIISIDVDLDKTTSQTISELKEIECIEDCSKNILFESQAVASDYSSEPLLNNQYYLNTINIGDAWKAIDNSRVFVETLVAVLDSGLDLDHEDVVGNFNGYSADVTKSGNPRLANCATTYNGNHGTAVWGVIRARPKNKKGITGMHLPVHDGYSGVIKVMAVKTKADGASSSTTANMIKGIEYAVEKGASVINISLSTSSSSTSLHNAVIAAYESGVTIVASAGNDGASNYVYPACYDEVIGVASTTQNNSLSNFSNRNNKIDICAPGSSIYTLNLDDAYSYFSGTSFSAPIVTGTVALMQSFYIDDTLSPDTVKSTLLTTATDLGILDSSTGFNKDLVNTGLAVEHARYLAMKQESLSIRSIVLSNSNKSKLRWNDFAFCSCDGYRVYRSTSASGTYSSIATIKRDDLSWDSAKGCFYWYDNSAQSGNTYYYKLRSYVDYGTSKKFSNYTSAKSITIP